MRITVVGDVLLDEDVDGTVERLCPDAPVPVVEVAARRSRAGGAGLVAAMLLRDGHDVELVTALSDDAGAERIRAHLEGVTVIAGDSGAPTPVKTRLRTAAQAVCRIDEGCGEPPVPTVDERMLHAVERADAILVSDYGRRLTAHPALREALGRRAADVPLVWDPHPRGAEPVPAAQLVTPNLAEAASAAGTPATPAEAGAAAELLRERYGCAGALVTLGDRGAVLAEEGAATLAIPTAPVSASDPCGAGDRLAASAIVALAGGSGRREAARSAVEAARAFLAAGGVASLASRPALSEAARPEANALDTARAVRDRGGVVVAAGGCFDLLHAGHVRTLEAARALGDCLIVCMNSDASVRRLKGPDRPIIGERDRSEMLDALACVDAVLVFEEDGPEGVLEQLRPDFWVKGGDYTVDALPETPLLERWGGRAVTLPYQLGRSTTRLAEALARVG